MQDHVASVALNAYLATVTGLMVDDCLTAAAEPVITSSVGRGLSGPCP